MTIWNIANWTINRRLRSWTGWLGWIGFTLFNALILWMLLNESSNPALGTGAQVHQTLMPQYLSTMALLILLISPTIHMNSIAGEVFQKRWTLYQTSPISNVDIIVGKWLGLTLYSWLLILTTIPSVCWMNQFIELLPIRWMIGYASILVFSAWLHALGILISARCQRPLTAWFGSAGLSLLLWFLGSLTGTVWLAISPMPKIHEMLDGWLNLGDLIFWISSCGMLIYLAQDSLEQKYWSHPRPFESRTLPYMWTAVLILSNAVALKYNRHVDLNPVRETLSSETIEMISNAESNLVLSVEMETQDPRFLYLQRLLRKIEHLDTVSVQFPKSHKIAIGKDAGLYLHYNGRVTSITGAIYPGSIHQALHQLIQPEESTVCITQGGGEPDMFDVNNVGGMGLWTEQLLAKGYKPRAINAHSKLDPECTTLIVVGRESPIEQSWLDAAKDTPSLLLLDPILQPIPYNWFATVGVTLRDDFVVEPNPQYQIGNNPTTVLLSNVNIQPHPTLKLDKQQILLQSVRSIQWNTTHTQHLGLEIVHASPQSWGETDYSSDTPSPTADHDLIGRVPLMVEVDKIQDGVPQSHLIILGSSSLVRNNFLERNPFNGNFAIQMLDTLGGKETTPPEPSSLDTRISLSPKQLRQYFWMWTVCLPTLLLGIFYFRRLNRFVK